MSSASHSAGSSGWLAQKTGAGPTFQLAGKVDAICRSRSKCCSRRVFRFEAVLVVDRRYVIGDVGEDDFFKELGCWGQEGNVSIGEALVGIFVWFGNRNYFC